MFLNNPSGVSGQYGTIAKNVGNKIFKNSDKQIIYYTSALALYRIEALMKSGNIDKLYWKTRYHAMMLLRIVISGEEIPRFNQRKMNDYCKSILKVLNDPNECLRHYKGIIEFIISKNEVIDLSDRKTFERKETTDYLLGKIDELQSFLASFQD